MLIFDDIFILSEISDKINLDIFAAQLEEKLQLMDDEFDKKYKDIDLTDEDIKNKNKKRNSKVMLELVFYIVKNLHKIKDQITDLFISVKGLKKEEVKKLNLQEIIDILKELFNDGVFDLLKEKLPEDLKKTL